ncbi:hypothetical protein HN592_00945 [Candidatus Woesearchaeota archaeon]|jgi:hypothetical protein|nr:hypothetical protein [Candidatus Woesearchaeota archaeon]MBT4368871.1 hypothetical protein [Candidatus Woesearchaeota archaeon]MBT4712160.1 hypothetical protein [Candidatus Woesearchaeota archaeon]MBT6639092.1 hypothetical protein [Candidatus Woesearchaeota archaeon]MBT7134292.1 hypothetical protein [Candidatus Woesearchaeota archaeon]
MIPEYDVEMHQRVSTRWIGMPGEEVLGFSEEEDDQGIDTRFLASNHQYEDYRWLDWENVARQITIERYLLEKADTQSKNAQEFEEFCSGVEGKIRDLGDIHEILHFDVGVSALTALTSAMGGAPMNSCRGHTRNKAAPGVAFYTTTKAAKAFFEYCKEFGCAIQHIRLEHYLPIHGLEIKARSVTPLLDLAEAMYHKFRR